MVLLAHSALIYISVKLVIFSFWFQIKKMLNAKPEDVCVKSPLSKLRSSERWDRSQKAHHLPKDTQYLNGEDNIQIQFCLAQGLSS